MPDQEFVYVKYDTRQDSGEMVLYSPDGHFEGECYLPATGDGSRMGLNVFSLANRQLLQGRVDTQAVETAEKPEQSVSGGSGKVEDAGFALSPSGKLSYSFKVPGRDTVKLKCKSPQEWHILTLDARDGYRYEGEINMPYTYPDDTVTVSVISTNRPWKSRCIPPVTVRNTTVSRSTAMNPCTASCTATGSSAGYRTGP